MFSSGISDEVEQRKERWKWMNEPNNIKSWKWILCDGWRIPSDGDGAVLKVSAGKGRILKKERRDVYAHLRTETFLLRVSLLTQGWYFSYLLLTYSLLKSWGWGWKPWNTTVCHVRKTRTTIDIYCLREPAKHWDIVFRAFPNVHEGGAEMVE